MSSSPPGDPPETLYLRAFEKAEARKKSGCDPLAADWQAILEIALNLACGHLRENPGRLLPLQIGNQEEWEFYLDLQEKLDLPPDTYAVLSTPSFSESLLDALDDQDLALCEGREVPWGKNAYLVIISDCHDHERIMQVSLPSASGTAGIDVYEDGKHLADYTFRTIEECMRELAKVPWVFFSPKREWTREQIVQYTENWFVKGFDAGGLQGLAIHRDFSYVHHPELLNLSSLESVFKLLEATVPAALEDLDAAIETTNDLNRDLDTGRATVTIDGILSDEPDQCRALAGRIALEMDQQLDEVERLKEVAFPDREDRDYSSRFEATARKIYEKTAGRPCPVSLMAE
jgi:hypothetical protein